MEEDLADLLAGLSDSASDSDDGSLSGLLDELEGPRTVAPPPPPTIAPPPAPPAAAVDTACSHAEEERRRENAELITQPTRRELAEAKQLAAEIDAQALQSARVPRVERKPYGSVAPAAFAKLHARRGVPVVLEGAAKGMGWKCADWSAKLMAETLPDLKVRSRVT